MNPSGYCKCGCGQKTNISPQNHKKHGWVKGEPFDYIRGHRHPPKGVAHYNYKGGRQKASNGYIAILRPDHPYADSSGRVFEHRLVAETVLGKFLPLNAVVHHVNENRSDNRSCNLVICQDNIYHKLLHQRKRALKACGHANWLKCPYCGKYDDPENMHYYPGHNRAYHPVCASKYNKKRYQTEKRREIT